MILTHLVMFKFWPGAGQGSVPPPTPTGGGGGAGGGGWYPREHRYGRAAWHRKKWDAEVADWIDTTAREMYADLTAKEMPKEVRKEAASIVRPFADVRGVPEPQKVDWAALAEEAAVTLELISLWRKEALKREILDDDDDILMLDFL